MMVRVSVSSKTSILARGGSPIHSIDSVNHGLGGFVTQRIDAILSHACNIVKSAGLVYRRRGRVWSIKKEAGSARLEMIRMNHNYLRSRTDSAEVRLAT